MTSLGTTLRYVHEYRDRFGQVHRYFRRRGQPLVKLPGQPGSREFMKVYTAAYAAVPQKIADKHRQSDQGTVNAAIVGYYQHSSFRNMALGSRNVRRRLLERFRKVCGDRDLAKFERQHIEKFLGQATPAVARNWLSALRGLMTFAVAVNLIKIDPTAGVKRAALSKEQEGFHSWTEAEIALYEARHPIGSSARLAMALLLYTAQRRSDVIGLGPQHIRDGIISLRQQKTGTPVEIPVHPELAAIIAASTIRDLAFIVSNKGAAYSDGAFGKRFAGWRRQAGLKGNCAAHGLRKAGLTRLAEAGCTAPELMAISGLKTMALVQHYIASANRGRLARTAMQKLLTNVPRT